MNNIRESLRDLGGIPSLGEVLLDDMLKLLCVIKVNYYL